MLLKPKLFSSQGVALLLLLAALATLFLPNPDRGLFHRAGLHNGISANHLIVAANMSPERRFAGVEFLTLDEQGAPSYSPYNRFPPGGYLLIKLAMLPFLDDLEARIYAARLLMLLFFAGTALVAQLALARLTANPWAALTAVFLAFSSYDCLYQSDLVATEAWPALFGVMLTFHGMVVFAQEGRFRQLLVKACLALLLGWQVLGLLFPFVVLGLAQALVSPPPSIGATPRPFSRLLRSPHLALGLVALCFATAVLSFNLANEYALFKGANSLTELPSFQSMRLRVGLSESFNAPHASTLAWPGFLETQFIDIGRLFLSAILISADAEVAPQPRFLEVAPRPWLLFWGVIAFCACLLGLAFTRHKSLWAVLALSGFCWTLPMRRSVAFNEHEVLFYIGIPLTLFSLLLLRARWIANNRLVLGMALVAGAAFVFSGARVARAGLDAAEARFQREALADFETIRKLTKEKTIDAPWTMRYMKRSDYDKALTAWPLTVYALTDRVIFGERKFNDVLLSPVRFDGPALLTPENRWVFLYDRSAYDEQSGQFIKAFGEPVARVVHGKTRKGKELLYELRRRDNLLMYVVRDARVAAPPFEPCGGRVVCDNAGGSRFILRVTPRELLASHPRQALGSRFMLRVTPVDANDLPLFNRRGNEKLDFLFRDHAFLDESRRVVAVRLLPDYPIARILTGRLDSEGEALWEAEISFEE